MQALYDTELKFSGTKKKVYHYTFYGVWVKLLGIFAKGEAINFLIHPSVVPIVNTFVHTNKLTEDAVRELAGKCPLLCHLFVTLPNKQLPVYAVPLFQQMIDICTSSYPWLYENNLSPQRSPQLVLKTPTYIGVTNPVTDSSHGFASTICTEPVIDEAASVVSGASYPFWPKLRNTHIYTGRDKVSKTLGSLQTAEHNTTQQWNDFEQGDDKPDKTEQCTKVENRGYKTKDLVSGVLVTCCSHTVKYGTAVMYAPEGRKDVMKVLYERLPQVVLDNLTVIYDFACQAAEYCISREPKMFCMTKFVIDRFHSNNHKCGSFWKLSTYPGFADLVSTASESLNAFIQRFHS
jgi:hypothetical protein